MANITKAEREKRKAEAASAAIPAELAPPVAPVADEPAAPKAATAGLVRMHRDPSTHSLPHAVEVPASEVENYKAGGFMVTEG